MNKRINLVRALVVDDSAFMRRLLTDLLESSGQIKVVGIARNGIDAVAKNQRLLPDVITLDVEMPEMDGLRALTELMRTRPVPVVMLSSLKMCIRDSLLTTGLPAAYLTNGQDVPDDLLQPVPEELIQLLLGDSQA